MPEPKRSNFTFRLPPHLIEALRQIAKSRGLTMNGAACVAVHDLAARDRTPATEDPPEASRAA